MLKEGDLNGVKGGVVLERKGECLRGGRVMRGGRVDGWKGDREGWMEDEWKDNERKRFSKSKR